LSEDEARQMRVATGGTPALGKDMTLALRVVFETEGKLIVFGDSFQVTPDGPKSLLQG